MEEEKGLANQPRVIPNEAIIGNETKKIKNSRTCVAAVERGRGWGRREKGIGLAPLSSLGSLPFDKNS